MMFSREEYDLYITDEDDLTLERVRSEPAETEFPVSRFLRQCF
jgi:hypothetical protein